GILSSGVLLLSIQPTWMCLFVYFIFFFFQAEDGIRDDLVTGVQTCALPICRADAVGHRVARVDQGGRQAFGTVPAAGRCVGLGRSEERRVGKECGCRWWAER